MKKRVLGRTGLQVSEIGLGGLFVATAFSEVAQAKAAVGRAVELGINYIDTAPSYHNSEEVLGEALSGIKAPVVLSTKLGGRPKPFNPRDKDALLQSVDESLRLLKRDAIDILMIHEPDRPGQYDWWEDFDRAVGPVMEVMDQLKSDGTIRFTGLGGTTAYEMARLIRTGKFDVVLTAFNYSLLWREAEIEVLPAAKKQNMGIVIGSALQQGALARRFDDEIASGAPWLNSPRRRQFKALYSFLDDLKMPINELAFRFVLSNPDVSTVLMGARSPQEVEQNVAAAEKGPLPDDVLKQLRKIAAKVPFRPYSEPFGLGWLLGKPTAYNGPGVA